MDIMKGERVWRKPPEKAQIKAVPFNLEEGFNQPLWVDIFVPRDAAPGEYTGEYRVTSDQGIVNGKINLTVWNFELPLKPSLKSSFNVWNLDGDLSLTKLSDLLNMNSTYFSRLYKQITGVNLSDFINEMRLNKASDLLRNTNLKIHEIAASTGYFTVSNFNRFFKKMTNMAPQEYRDSICSLK